MAKITVKNADVLAGLMGKTYHPLLVEIIIWVASEHGCTITESFRPQRHQNDLHGVDPVRAIDLRTWCYPDGMAERIRDEVNKRWQYDPKRPGKQVAIIHDVGEGVHFHIQVHPRTVRRV